VVPEHRKSETGRILGDFSGENVGRVTGFEPEITNRYRFRV
jgi:hypothetical protein